MCYFLLDFMVFLGSFLAIILLGAAIFAVSMYYAIKIERETGYYEYPDCGRHNWQKKVLTKD